MSGKAYIGAPGPIGPMDPQETRRPQGPYRVKVIQVIETESLEGRGTEKDPCRRVTQYWSMEGKMLAAVYGRPIYPVDLGDSGDCHCPPIGPKGPLGIGAKEEGRQNDV